MATYDQLINDRQFLTNLYDTYKELNYDIPETNQEMVDDFLSRRRSFEDNIVGTVALGSDVDRLSDEGKSRFGEVYRVLLAVCLQAGQQLPVQWQQR